MMTDLLSYALGQRRRTGVDIKREGEAKQDDCD